MSSRREPEHEYTDILDESNSISATWPQILRVARAHKGARYQAMAVIADDGLPETNPDGTPLFTFRLHIGRVTGLRLEGRPF